MRKRLRKKLHKGEFQEMGFEVQFHLPADFNEAHQSAFFDSFIQEAIETKGLICGGACVWPGTCLSLSIDEELPQRSIGRLSALGCTDVQRRQGL